MPGSIISGPRLKARHPRTRMPPSRKPSGRAASSAKPPQLRLSPNPRLNSAMACDTAFRIVARRYLGALNANHAATCNGDPDALHRMRVALTHLRTAILFFSPMVHDEVRDEVRDELKWLNSELGAVRDLDVAVDRVKNARQAAASGRRRAGVMEREVQRGTSPSARMLSSVRYRWLVDQTSGWIENGPWSTKKGKQAAQERASPLGAYSAAKLRGMGRKAAEEKPQASQDGNERNATVCGSSTRSSPTP